MIYRDKWTKWFNPPQDDAGTNDDMDDNDKMVTDAVEIR